MGEIRRPVSFQWAETAIAAAEDGAVAVSDSLRCCPLASGEVIFAEGQVFRGAAGSE